MYLMSLIQNTVFFWNAECARDSKTVEYWSFKIFLDQSD